MCVVEWEQNWSSRMGAVECTLYNRAQGRERERERERLKETEALRFAFCEIIKELCIAF